MKISICVIMLVMSFSSVSMSKTKKTQNNFQKLELINKIMYLIEKNYYQEVDNEVLVEGALRGIMDSLDQHSTYLDKELFKKMQEDTKGEFGGVGIEVSYENGVLKIISAIEDTPAFKAGLHAGDQIIEINHENILRLSVDKAIEKMQGKAGEKLHLGVRREGDKKIIGFDIIREIIRVKPVKSKLVDDVAIIRLVQFQDNSGKFISKAISNLEKKAKNGIKGFILDFRGNPGGLLDEAVNVASIFLEKGIVVSTESRDPSVKDIRYVRKSGKKYTTQPVIVLVDKSSASASEIVAGALQDHKRAVVMGRTSYGKGTVQSVTPLDENTAIKLTISQYLTPLKRKIHKKGIKPDIELKKVDRFKNRNYLIDHQIKSALDKIKKL